MVDRLIEELKRDSKASKRLAELLVSEPHVRLAIVNAALTEVAAKRDLEILEERLENRINNINTRLERVKGQLTPFVKLFIALISISYWLE